MSKRIVLFVLSIVALFQIDICAQTVVTGKISDAKTGEPIPYANVVFKNTTIGVMSDVNGSFKLTTKEDVDSVLVSAIGYEPSEIKLLNNKEQRINIALREDVYELEEIVILPTENPAHPIFRNVVKNKKRNNPDNLPDWKSSIYNKIQVDLKNIKRPKKENKIFKQFDFVFDHIDTIADNGKTYLPAFISETQSDYYHYNKQDDHEIIKASRASGFSTDMITQFTGQFYTDYNVYDNFIFLADVGLISPVNDQGLQFYRYYLTDSVLTETNKRYRIKFIPKRKLDPAFTGHMWIDKSSYAVVSAELKMSRKVNVNFIRDFKMGNWFKQQDSLWVPQKQYVFIDLNINQGKKDKFLGLLGRKTSIYGTFDFETPKINAVKLKTPTQVEKAALDKTEQDWTLIRPEPLSQQESNIYSMVDSIKNVPLFKTIEDYVLMLMVGYKEFGDIELGPYYYLYSNNKVEGNRVRLGMRTLKGFHDNLRLSGYMAYGFGDEKVKYGMGAEYFWDTNPLDKLEIKYTHDYELLGKSPNAFSSSNILSTILSRNPNSNLLMQNQFDIEYTKEWFTGFSNSLRLRTLKIFSNSYVPFNTQNGDNVSSLRATELNFRVRLAKDERIVVGDFDRYSYGSEKPIITFDASYGMKGIFNGDYEYLKLNLNIFDRLYVNPVGFLEMNFAAGQVFGKVPFPFLKLHEANETYVFDKYAGNLLNYYEFASDRYASLYVEHHMQGFFMNRVPLFKWLKWREVLGFRAIAGELNTRKYNELKFPQGMTGLDKKPYMEFSVGFENILKVIRIDYIRRINYKHDAANIDGIRASLQLIF